MKAIINGKEKFFNKIISITELLKSYNVNMKIVIVEKNGEIIPREEFDTTEVNEGDKIEIVKLVGGG